MKNGVLQNILQDAIFEKKGTHFSLSQLPGGTIAKG